MLFVKDSAVWKQVTPYVKSGGVWVKAKQVYVNSGGVWKPLLKDPNYASVSLLVHGDGADGSTTITDNSPTPKTVTASGNARISTAQSFFSGGSSIAFDGNGDYITAPSDTSFAFSGDFTIEYLIRFNTLPATDFNVWHTLINGGISLYQTPTRNSWQIARSGQASALSFSWTPAAATWYHFAVSRTGSTMRVFVNGTQLASGSVTTSFLQSGFQFGRDYLATRWLDGWVEELRITKGVGRYTANFTVQDIPFFNA